MNWVKSKAEGSHFQKSRVTLEIIWKIFSMVYTSSFITLAIIRHIACMHAYYDHNYICAIINNNYYDTDFFQPSKIAKEQGISITLPDGNSFEFGKEQGRKVGWSHEQGRRVPFGEKQGIRVGWSHEQGRRVPFGEKQGIRVGWGKEQGFGRRVAWGEQQGAKPVYSVKEQSPVNPWLGYQYPFSKEQGIRLIPSAKQQSPFRYNPGFNPFYAKQQGRRIVPTTKQQDIQFPYPLHYYNTPISSKDKNIRAAIESIYNTAG